MPVHLRGVHYNKTRMLNARKLEYTLAGRIKRQTGDNSSPVRRTETLLFYHFIDRQEQSTFLDRQ